MKRKTEHITRKNGKMNADELKVMTRKTETGHITEAQVDDDE